MKTLLKKFLLNESGAALVEYGVALLVVILVGVGGLVILAEGTGAQFSDAAGAMEEVREAAEE
jgi:Flp pilus assembly pilin Flp